MFGFRFFDRVCRVRARVVEGWILNRFDRVFSGCGWVCFWFRSWAIPRREPSTISTVRRGWRVSSRRRAPAGSRRLPPAGAAAPRPSASTRGARTTFSRSSSGSRARSATLAGREWAGRVSREASLGRISSRRCAAVAEKVLCHEKPRQSRGHCLVVWRISTKGPPRRWRFQEMSLIVPGTLALVLIHFFTYLVMFRHKTMILLECFRICYCMASISFFCELRNRKRSQFWLQLLHWCFCYVLPICMERLN